MVTRRGPILGRTSAGPALIPAPRDRARRIITRVLRAVAHADALATTAHRVRRAAASSASRTRHPLIATRAHRAQRSFRHRRKTSSVSSRSAASKRSAAT